MKIRSGIFGLLAIATFVVIAAHMPAYPCEAGPPPVGLVGPGPQIVYQWGCE